MHNMKMLDIFRIPVYSFKFKDHEKFKENWSQYLEDYDYTKHKKLRKKLSENNKKKAANYSWDRIYSEYMNEYEDLIRQ